MAKSKKTKGTTVASKQKYYENLGWKFKFDMKGGVHAEKGSRRVKGTSLTNIFTKI